MKLVAAAVMVAAIAATALYVKGLRADNARLELENSVIVTKLSEQNAAIENLKAAADEKMAAARVEIERARRDTIVARRKAQEIFQTKPSTPDDPCKSALDLINGVTQ
jgi:hypothetical protein